MIKTDVLILGGGLAGLSTAYHLNRQGSLESLIVEKEPSVGGTAGSFEKNGFVFDHTGHLLHLHDAYGKKLVLELLQGNLALHQRSSWIYSRGIYTRYPFQANTHGLPSKVIDECLLGFFKTLHRPDSVPRGPSFRDWCLRTFGAGICKHFMFPYNEKLWRRPLSELNTEWQGRFVPKPSAAEVLCGAILDQRKFFGYNATFRYPRRGGIQVLPDALAARLKPGQVRTGSPALAVDLRERVASIQGVGEIRYERLVNTLPLVDFLDLARPLPSEISEARGRLRYNTVYCLNLGFDRRDSSGRHWVYYPENKYPFYRVGYYSRFAQSNSPRDATSLYIETTRPAGVAVDLARLENSMLKGLRECGILRRSDRILVKLWKPIRCGYVVYDFARAASVNAIMRHLASVGADSIGRYGAWKYSFMEETLLDGKRCAEQLSGLTAEAASQSPEKELRPLR
ncbi:MAG: FAD-dependent oxidoreductase [Elusimicrobia bacterium]|nr:FAD-dependent oxidoreductase [Elusimicrobiota bacterium]